MKAEAHTPNSVLKVMAKAQALDAAERLRFLERARRILRVEHTNLGVIHEVSDDAATGIPYVVREFVEGETLETILANDLLTMEMACSIALEMLAGLAALHAAGLCHGNLKPSNVIVNRSQQGNVEVHLVDMGWRHWGLEGERCLDATTRYLSPEILLGEAPNAQSDLFAVAVILYELLAGAPLVEMDDSLEAFRAVATDTVEPLSQRNPHLPEALARAVETCLLADPSQRLASAGALARQLRPFVSQRPAREESWEQDSLTPSLAPLEPTLTPSLMLLLAPRPRRDAACPDGMLVRPEFPRLQPSSLLKELREDLDFCPPSETEGFEEPAPRGKSSDPTRAAQRAGSSPGVGAALAWLRSII